MPFHSRSCLAIFITSMLMLTGCQTPSLASKTSSPNIGNNDSQTVSYNQFSLQGKIGVKTPQQSGSAFFTWIQQEEQFDIELSGILGIGKTQITGEPGKVELNSSRTGLISAESPEELLLLATGWNAPITHIIDWVQAHPATLETEILKDNMQRPIQFIEDGWTVDLSYKDEAVLPNRLVLKQALDSNQENRITMIIQNR